jgi:RNA polymerase sigma-70 factor (ECF subfamily)
MLSDDVADEDIVQQAWLRLQGTDQEIANLPAWLTTVTSRLCPDRLRARVIVRPAAEPAGSGRGRDRGRRGGHAGNARTRRRS